MYAYEYHIKEALMKSEDVSTCPIDETGIIEHILPWIIDWYEADIRRMTLDGHFDATKIYILPHLE
jgi:hypothetical protein